MGSGDSPRVGNYEARKRKTHAGLGGNAILRFSSGKLGDIAQRGADLLYYAPLDIKSDSKESTNRALFSKD